MVLNVDFINIMVTILEGIFGNKYIVMLFVFFVVTIILIAVKVPMPITSTIDVFLEMAFLPYGLPIPIFIISLIIWGFMLAGYIIKEIGQH